MGVYDDTLDYIERGRLGLNEGLSFGVQTARFQHHIPNIQLGNIYLIGGMSGSGKSAFAYDQFIMAPYDDWFTNKRETYKLKIFIWTLEISKELAMAKFICHRLMRKYKILVDTKFILSQGKYRINDDVYQKILQEREFFQQFEEVVTFYGTDSPTGIYSKVKQWLLKEGKELHKDPVTVKETDETGGRDREKTFRPFDRYVPNHPNTYVLVIVDHVNILKSEEGLSKKGRIDRLSDYMVDMSNRYKIIPIFVQQVGRATESTDRFKLNTLDIQQSDFKETSDLTDAAHNVITINHPQRWELRDYRGYNLEQLGDRARFVGVIKNRHGTANHIDPMLFIGETGMYSELPVRPNRSSPPMTENDYRIVQQIKKTYDI